MRPQVVTMKFKDKTGGAQLLDVDPAQVRAYEEMGWRRLNPLPGTEPARVTEEPVAARVIPPRRK